MKPSSVSALLGAIAAMLAMTAAGAQESFRLTRPNGEGTSMPSPQGQAPISQPPEGMANSSPSGDKSFGGGASHPIELHIEKMANTVKLNASELAELGRHDIVLIVDKSESMRAVDCPSLTAPGYLVSRWDWCGQQAYDLAQQAAPVLPDGLGVVIFSNFTRAFPHMGAQDIPTIFTANHPGGMTNEAAAVELVLQDYFSRRKQEHGKVRPLVVAVITDGLPTNPLALKRDLVEATRQMKGKEEISFTFLQVGTDPEGVGFIRDLDQNLRRENAKYDIVTSKTFPELVHTGLAKALVDCLSAASQ
jgi:hypothetical protein